MKRSSSVVLLLMGAVSTAAVLRSTGDGETYGTYLFRTPQDCRASGIVTKDDPPDICQKRWDEAIQAHRSDPGYDTQAACEQAVGAVCAPRPGSGGAVSFLPLMAGFLMGSNAQPVYADRRGGFVTAGGASIGFDSGRVELSRDVYTASARAGGRSSAIGRGGFGGTGKAMGGRGGA